MGWRDYYRLLKGRTVSAQAWAAAAKANPNNPLDALAIAVGTAPGDAAATIMALLNHMPCECYEAVGTIPCPVCGRAMCFDCSAETYGEDGRPDGLVCQACAAGSDVSQGVVR